jgi:hypothetical protein
VGLPGDADADADTDAAEGLICAISNNACTDMLVSIRPMASVCHSAALYLFMYGNHGRFIRSRNSCTQDVSSMWSLSRSSWRALAPTCGGRSAPFLVQARKTVLSAG